METSPSGGSVQRSFPVAEQPETGEVLRAVDPATMPPVQRSEELGEVSLEGLQDENKALRQELLEAKKSLLVLKEEVAAAMLAAREHASKRMASEVRVKSLEVREERKPHGIGRVEVTTGRRYAARPCDPFVFENYPEHKRENASGLLRACLCMFTILISPTFPGDALKNNRLRGHEYFHVACKRLYRRVSPLEAPSLTCFRLYISLTRVNTTGRGRGQRKSGSREHGGETGSEGQSLC